MTVRLQPWGTVAGRIVDDEGRPRKGIGHRQHRRLPDSRQPETTASCPAPTGQGIRVGDDGRFRVEGLVPGLKYGGDRRGPGSRPAATSSTT